MTDDVDLYRPPAHRGVLPSLRATKRAMWARNEMDRDVRRSLRELEREISRGLEELLLTHVVNGD